MRPPKFKARHSINCFCPTCTYSVTKIAESTVSQQDADNKAEIAATDEFSKHDCPCR